ncbi:MAG: hypothetical protein AAF721_04850, partial [Myxococcota bacterium]
MRRWQVGLLIAGLGACGADEGGRGDGPDPFASGITAAGDGVGDDAATSGDGEPDDGDDGGEKLDVPDDPAPPSDACYAADILFVVDNSGSMCEAQVGLSQVVPDL